MKEQPAYKSIKVTFATWQALTRISAVTGETRGRIIDRLVTTEEERLTVPKGEDRGESGEGEKSRDALNGVSLRCQGPGTIR